MWKGFSAADMLSYFGKRSKDKPFGVVKTSSVFTTKCREYDPLKQTNRDSYWDFI